MVTLGLVSTNIEKGAASAYALNYRNDSKPVELDRGIGRTRWATVGAWSARRDHVGQLHKADILPDRSLTISLFVLGFGDSSSFRREMFSALVPTSNQGLCA